MSSAEGGGAASREELIVRAQSGDHEAFDLIARPVSAHLYAVALRILRDVYLAEDAVQDSLVDAWRDLRALRDPALFDGWITRILVRNCYRAAKRDRASHQIAAPARDHAPDISTQIAEHERLQQAFLRLTPDHRVVVVMRYFLGWEPAAIAEALDLAPGTVRSRLHYGLDALRAALEADGRTDAFETGGKVP